MGQTREVVMGGFVVVEQGKQMVHYTSTNQDSVEERSKKKYVDYT